MVLETVGDLKELIQTLPDSMPLRSELGPDVDDLMLDAGLPTPETLIFFAATETRCDEVPALYVGVDLLETAGEDDKEDDADE
jgi:hypothetical protein